MDDQFLRKVFCRQQQRNERHHQHATADAEQTRSETNRGAQDEKCKNQADIHPLFPVIIEQVLDDTAPFSRCNRGNGKTVAALEYLHVLQRRLRP